MNKRLKKKIEKRRREKILHVLDLVLQVNGLSGRKWTETGKLPTAFFEYAGHVTEVSVRVFPEGWGIKDTFLYDSFRFYTDGKSMEAASVVSSKLKEIRDSVKI